MPPAPRLKQLDLPLATDEAMQLVYSAWTEEALLSSVRRMAKACGYLCYHTKFSIKSDAGFPDLCLVRGGETGRLLFAELKREGKWPTEGRLAPGLVPRWVNGQYEWLKTLQDAGQDVYLWWPSDQRDIADILTDGPRPEMACVQRIRDYLREKESAT
jgi:hypothetical protein